MLRPGVAIAALRTLPVFEPLSDVRLQGISQAASLKRISRGTTVVHAGDRVDYVYVVLTGSLKVLFSDDEGREVILSMFNPGDLFGEMGVIDDHPRSATVVAVEPSDLVVISKADFKRFLSENADITLYIMRSLVQRLRIADRKIESLALMDVYGRVARLLLEMAEKRDDGRRMIMRKLTKQDIARMIGASREMVSRVMRELQTRGLVEETDAGIILNESILPADSV